MSVLIDLTGQKFGRLTVLCRGDDYIKPSGKRDPRWRCVCECGNIVEVIGYNLKRGKSTSCGCYRNECSSVRNSTHGDGREGKKRASLYNVWCAMRARCANPKSTYYKDYGGRGISVCEEWKCDYVAFKAWAVSNGYSEGLTIDRIDVDGNYCPENCRWVDRVAQANNRRSNRLYTYNGETHNIGQWAKLYDIPYSKLHSRLYSGWDMERALFTQ